MCYCNNPGDDEGTPCLHENKDFEKSYAHTMGHPENLFIYTLMMFLPLVGGGEFLSQAVNDVITLEKVAVPVPAEVLAIGIFTKSTLYLDKVGFILPFFICIWIMNKPESYMLHP